MVEIEDREEKLHQRGETQLNTMILDRWIGIYFVDGTEGEAGIAKLVQGSTIRRSRVRCICISAKEMGYLMAPASAFTCLAIAPT